MSRDEHMDLDQLLAEVHADLDALNDDPNDAVFEAYARGELRRADALAQLSLADEEEAERMLDAVAPLPAAFQAQVVQASRVALSQPQPTAAPKTRWWSVWLPVLAAAVLLVGLWPATPDPLPTYQLEVSGFDAPTRSEQATPRAQVSADGMVRALLRPASATEAQATPVVRRVGPEGAVVGQAQVEAFEGGAVEVRVPASALQPGLNSLWIGLQDGQGFTLEVERVEPTE